MRLSESCSCQELHVEKIMGLDPGFLITYHTRANKHRLNLTRFRNTCLLFLDQSGLTLKPQ